MGNDRNMITSLKEKGAGHTIERATNQRRLTQCGKMKKKRLEKKTSVRGE